MVRKKLKLYDEENLVGRIGNLRTLSVPRQPRAGLRGEAKQSLPGYFANNLSQSVKKNAR